MGHQNNMEDRFILNLTRLTEHTAAVAPEHMLEICAHINNESIAGLQWIEAEYLSMLFEDTELDTPVCSVEYIMKRYEEAKACDNTEYLIRLRNAHRRARQFLDNPQVKNDIKQFIAGRPAHKKRTMLFDVLYPVMQYLQTYGADDTTGKALSSMLPDVLSSDVMLGHLEEHSLPL